MFLPHHLVTLIGLPAVPPHGAFLDRAEYESERRHAMDAKLALAGYMVATLVDRAIALEAGEPVAAAFQDQLLAVRRHLGELPPGSAEVARLSAIVTAVSGAEPSVAGARGALAEYAAFLEHAGRLEEALDLIGLLAVTWPDGLPASEFAARALTAGRLNRVLARWDAARACYAAAEEAGRAIGDATAVLRGRLGQGAVARGVGNLPLARRTAEEIAAEAAGAGLPEVEALAQADLGAALSLLGLPLEALRAKSRALHLAPRLGARMRALGDLGIGLRELGAYEAARLAFELVVESIEGCVIVRRNATIELMDLESMLGKRWTFERHRVALEPHYPSMPPSMAADYQYRVGVGFARFGLLSKARNALEKASRVAHVHGLHAWAFRIERVLSDLDVPCGDDETPLEEVALPSYGAGVEQLVAGLRGYAVQFRQTAVAD